MTSIRHIMNTLKVALPVPLLGLFDYLPCTDVAIDEQWIGCRVEVPFGTRQLIGWVSALGEPTEEPNRLKCITQRIDPYPIISTEWLTSMRWVANYSNINITWIHVDSAIKRCFHFQPQVTKRK